MPTRLSPDRLRRIARLLFHDNRYHGGDLGRALRRPGNSVYVMFHRTGLPLDMAERLVVRLEEWADELRDAAASLHRLRAEALHEPPALPTPAPRARARAAPSDGDEDRGTAPVREHAPVRRQRRLRLPQTPRAASPRPPVSMPATSLPWP